MSKKPLFDLGPIVATPGALEVLERNRMTGLELLKRHVTGDWGDLCEEDKKSNEDALITGARIFSHYLLPDESKLYVITDAEIDEQHHRYCTTLLRPEDY